MSDRVILSELKARNMNSITLAFIGDAVYSLHVRLKNVMSGDHKAGELNELTSHTVCAVAQAELVEKLLPNLNETELEVFKRARNAKKPTKSKHASVAQYSKSTGFEALIGFLYLTGNDERLQYILDFKGENQDATEKND